jgi:hypothetical protein
VLENVTVGRNLQYIPKEKTLVFFVFDILKPQICFRQITTLVMIGTDCTGSCNTNNHTIMTILRLSITLILNEIMCIVIRKQSVLFDH